MTYKVIKIDALTDPDIHLGDIGEYVEGGRSSGQMVRLRINNPSTGQDITAWFFGDEVVKL